MSPRLLPPLADEPYERHSDRISRHLAQNQVKATPGNDGSMERPIKPIKKDKGHFAKLRSSSEPYARQELRMPLSGPLDHRLGPNTFSSSYRSTSLPSSRKEAIAVEEGRDESSETPDGGVDNSQDDKAEIGQDETSEERIESSSLDASLMGLADLTKEKYGSGSSSSGSTITSVSFTRKDNNSKSSPSRHRPDALSFLDPDSPAVTEESIQRSMADAANWRSPVQNTTEAKTSPSARSSSSSSSDSFRSDGSGHIADHETDSNTSPEQSIDGDAGSPTPKPTPNPKAQIQAAQRQHPTHRYGTPEMPRGNANLPHRPVNVLNPRVPNQGHVKHLPRAEKLPLTGYELLAAKLSSHPPSFGRSRRGSISGSSVRSGRSTDETPQIPPIYRRFEALNHRLLLHLQDELAELEEQLHRLDTADTQTRRLANRILPASRRTEFMAAGELQWHRTDILGKIGYKLGQYNHVLSSFTETQRLASPSLSDIENYRTYLATQQPIAEIETRFLDPTEDLVSLSNQPCRSPSPSASAAEYFAALDEEVLTPMPRVGPFLPRHSPPPSSRASSTMSRSRPVTADDLRTTEATRTTEVKEGKSAVVTLPSELPHLAIATAVAVVVPVLTFAVIPGFVGRMTVVLLVALAVFGAQVQAGTLGGAGQGKGMSSADLLVCASVYGGMMAVVAGLFA